MNTESENSRTIEDYAHLSWKEEALNCLSYLRCYQPSYLPRLFEINLTNLKKCLGKGITLEEVESDADEIAQFERELEELHLPVIKKIEIREKTDEEFARDLATLKEIQKIMKK